MVHFSHKKIHEMKDGELRNYDTGVKISLINLTTITYLFTNLHMPPPLYVYQFRPLHTRSKVELLLLPFAWAQDLVLPGTDNVTGWMKIWFCFLSWVDGCRDQHKNSRLLNSLGYYYYTLVAVQLSMKINYSMLKIQKTK